MIRGGWRVVLLLRLVVVGGLAAGATPVVIGGVVIGAAVLFVSGAFTFVHVDTERTLTDAADQCG